MKYYARNLIVVIGSLIAADILLNIIIDPYDVTKIIRIDGINASKTKEWENARLTKPFDIARQNYDGVILGTSQVERGFDPLFKEMVSQNKSVFNMGLSEFRLQEAIPLLEYSATKSRIKWAIISLDFSRYNRQPEKMNAILKKDWDRSQLVGDYLLTLVSAKGFADSISTIKSNITGRPALQHMPKGMLNVDEYITKIGQPNTRSAFENVDAAYINYGYSHMISQAHTFTRTGYNHEILKNILKIARERNIELYFIIPPVHARGLEVVEYLGLTPLLNQWKREISCILEDEAASTAGKTAFTLWDFSGYNEITTEAVPEDGANAKSMMWFNDTIHFKTSVGNLILNRVLDLNRAETSTTRNFGYRINPINLSGKIIEDEEARKRYLNKFPETVGNIEGLYNGLPGTKLNLKKPGKISSHMYKCR
jgi:hypothetical protein